MKILETEKKICPCCMEKHDIKKIAITENNIFKNIPVEYEAEYYYCDFADEAYANEQQIIRNDIAFKNAYRKKTGLLISDQISAIRAKYNISQSDLCTLLGWGKKTIARYERHQVQDVAHDTILRKIDSDPEWFLQLLQAVESSLSVASFEKYTQSGISLFEQKHDAYLKSAIMSKYARFLRNTEANGGKTLSLDVVVDMIHYFANSKDVVNLFMVKLMKLLWYADALSYKRHGHSISGLVYRALPMGAVPIAYESIVDLSTINCEEIDIGNGTGYKFLPIKDKKYKNLSLNDIEVLNAVIERFGKVLKNEVVETMHQEDAYTKTALYDIIQFKYTKTLSLS